MVKCNCDQRIALCITGRIQGVGFRPYIYHLATKLNLTGWVQNTAFGVCIEIQGQLISEFIASLTESLPPLAKIDQIETQPIEIVADEKDFRIIHSTSGKTCTLIAPDTHTCSACLQELFDPQSRYYRYPFLNCTNCGPRFTLTKQLPYDRQFTSMDTFPLCEACNAEYLDPANRRYHAQPTACQDCGPQLSTSIEDIVDAIKSGKIIAIKGLGGYQLWCDARNVATINELRKRKNRLAKPFALMVLNVQSATTIVEVDAATQHVLESTARPIVLLKKQQHKLPQELAPDLTQLGVMLPATPIHYLIFNAFAGYPDGCEWLQQAQDTILVVTSANVGGNPLIIDDAEAQQELSSIADMIVFYNRQIITRTDDSVIHMINQSPTFIRRARGYVPEPIELPYPIPTTLATGAHLKNTFCLTRGAEAFVAQHLGSLENKATIDFFHESLNHWLKFLNVKVERIACDLHPNFYTTQYAQQSGLPLYPIQHHHAHLAAVAAEQHVIQPAIGLVLDGYGYGHDKEAWGGELLYIKNKHFQRIAHFLPLPQPGGDRAAREPWRMAVGVLHMLGIERPAFQNVQQELIAQLLKSNMPIKRTSSCGRLFDAASALLGVSTVSQYEGHAAMQLEALVTQPEVLPYGWEINQDQLNFLPLLKELLNLNPIRGANIFHGTLIAGLTEWVLMWVQKKSCQNILLSGGCFLNKILTEGLTQQLKQHGLQIFMSQKVPPNDGGLSLGQAWVAGRL